MRNFILACVAVVAIACISYAGTANQAPGSMRWRDGYAQPTQCGTNMWCDSETTNKTQPIMFFCDPSSTNHQIGTTRVANNPNGNYSVVVNQGYGEYNATKRNISNSTPYTYTGTCQYMIVKQVYFISPANSTFKAWYKAWR